MTYKLVPGEENKVSIGETYGKEQATKVIKTHREAIAAPEQIKNDIVINVGK